MNCGKYQNELEEMVLNPSAKPSAAMQSHLAACSPCSTELAELRKTFNALDGWTAAEPSPWFDTRLAARLRTEQTASPAGFFERLRSRLLYNTGAQFRPLMAGALALVLVVGGITTYVTGGGSSTSVAHLPQTPAAVVNDLQILDRNDQAIQAVDLLDDNAAPDDGGTSQI